MHNLCAYLCILGHAGLALPLSYTNWHTVSELNHIFWTYEIIHCHVLLLYSNCYASFHLVLLNNQVCLPLKKEVFYKHSSKVIAFMWWRCVVALLEHHFPSAFICWRWMKFRGAYCTRAALCAGMDAELSMLWNCISNQLEHTGPSLD